METSCHHDVLILHPGLFAMASVAGAMQKVSQGIFEVGRSSMCPSAGCWSETGFDV